MPPRKPEPVVAGVLKSPCASSQTTHAAGSRRASAGSVETQIEQSDASSTGYSPASSAPSSASPAAAIAARESRRSSA
jgi:hypothetical protein